MTPEQFLAELETELPCKLPVEVQGKTKLLTLWVWRLSPDDSLLLAQAAANLPTVTEDTDMTPELAKQQLDMTVQLLALCIGTDEKAGHLNSDQGRAFIRRLPLAKRNELVQTAVEMNELFAVSEARKKVAKHHKLFVIAHSLGYSSPRRMLRDLTREELLDALAFYELDPPGDRRADLRAFAAALVSAGAEDPPKPIYPYYGETLDDIAADDEAIEWIENQRSDAGSRDC